MSTNSVQGLVNNGAGSVSNAPLTGANPLPIYKGGTGASTVAEALENLGVVAGGLSEVADDESPVLGGNLNCDGSALDNVGGITMDDAANIILDTTTGTKIGTAVGQKLSFYGASPIAQMAHADQAALSLGSTINSSAYGCASSADFNATIALLSEMRTVLVNLGLMKGST